jgi:Lon protease-like protein
MTGFLPLFPLNIVVFPGENLNLHIFEERYKQLIRECHELRKNFGIPFVFGGNHTNVGAEVRITEIARVFTTGEMDIRTQFVRHFDVLDFYPVSEDKLYPAGIVKYWEEPAEKMAAPPLYKIQEVIEKLYKIVSLTGVSDKFIPAIDDFTVFKFAHYLNMPKEEELRLVCCKSESQRIEIVLGYLDYLIEHIEGREKVRKLITANGHFKHLESPKF